MALQYASQRSAASYLVSLKPIVDTAMMARGEWLRFLGDMPEGTDLAAEQLEIVPIAIRQRERFNEARRRLNQLPPPPAYRDMEQALDRWLAALAGSADAIASIRGQPLSDTHVATARRRLRDAAQAASKFNAERASVITVGAPPMEAEQPRVPFRPNLRLILPLLLVLLLGGGGIYYLTSRAGTPAATLPTKPSIEVRTFSQPEVLERLRQEIAGRRVAFQNPDVRLVEPDTVIITGEIQGPSSAIPVEATLRLSVTADGKPRVTAIGISATGIQVPQEALDALNLRAEEGNRDLALLLKPEEVVRRLAVEGNNVIAEIETVPAGAAPSGGPAPAKPANP